VHLVRLQRRFSCLTNLSAKHGAMAAIGSGSQVLESAGFIADDTKGIFAGDAVTVTAQVLDALSGPVTSVEVPGG